MSPVDFPLTLPGCAIDAVRHRNGKRWIDAHTIAPSACCPRCQHASTRIHSRSVRTPRDVPVSAWPVCVALHVRRFFGRQPDCPQQTFAERVPDLVPFRGQRTVRFTRRLQVLATALRAEAGARVAVQSQLPTSPDTLLRLLRAMEPPPPPVPRVLGVDDCALQKGRTYGTILVDLEQRRPIDLLPDRRAETLTTWLCAHPGVAVIARARSTEYARGAMLGAPDALHVPTAGTCSKTIVRPSNAS
jgi:transposase